MKYVRFRSIAVFVTVKAKQQNWNIYSHTVWQTNVYWTAHHCNSWRM